MHSFLPEVTMHSFLPEICYIQIWGACAGPGCVSVEPYDDRRTTCNCFYRFLGNYTGHSARAPARALASTHNLGRLPRPQSESVS